ncbi:hemerythrin domain-containing protein [Lachnospiraceae bacterium C1.1]|nr:hemerythrin domain-containing protein [Lachnospiraceae bacterium C1.1]
MYQFTDDCLIGNDLIDGEHRHLFGMINEAAEAEKNPDANFEELLDSLLRELSEYASYHFEHEENFMKEINDPELPLQQIEHNGFIRLIKRESLKEITRENARERYSDILGFGEKWLYHHIKGSDALIGTGKRTGLSLFEVPMSFSDKYMTNIGFVDEGNRRIFEKIQSVSRIAGILGTDGHIEEVMSELSDLKRMAAEHFTAVENYLSGIGCDVFIKQKRHYDAFVEKVSSVNMNYIDKNRREYLEDLTDFLLYWFSSNMLFIGKNIKFNQIK